MERGGVVIYGLCLMVVVLMSASYEACAQKMPERRLIREGNREYEKGEYQQSELEYRRALEKRGDSYEAEYNLSNSLYKQERFEESAEKYSSLAQREDVDIEESARGHYNAGNSLFKERKFKEALEEYKESLRKNPNDFEAKYNLAYTKKMLEQQDQEDDGGGDDEKKEDNSDDPPKNDQDEGGDDKKDDEKEQQAPPNKPNTMSKEEAEQLLEAMQMNEDKTRDKMEEKEVTAVSKSGKNW